MTTRQTAEAGRMAMCRELFEQLSADYPHLPVQAVLHAVAEADRALCLCGDGRSERLTLESASRNNLDALAAALVSGATGMP